MFRFLPLRALVHDVAWHCEMNRVCSKDAHGTISVSLTHLLELQSDPVFPKKKRLLRGRHWMMQTI